MSKAQDIRSLFLGLAVITCVAVNEIVRQPLVLDAEVLAVSDLLLSVAGLAQCLPAAFRLIRQRRLPGVALAVVGMPLAVFFAGGLALTILSAGSPRWPLHAAGAGGLALTFLAFRELSRDAARGQ